MYLLFFRRPGKKWSTAQLSESPSNGMHASSYNSYNSVYRMYLLCDVTMTTRQKMPSLLLNSTEQCFAAHVVHTCQQYWTILLSLNIVDSYEQCWQQNIVQSCFHQYCVNLSVFTRVGSLTDHVSIYSAGLGI